MDAPFTILLLDDEPDLLEIYQVFLRGLASKPTVHTAETASKAFALLESGNFDLFITDLRMPKMDGLQVLAIVRRKFPDLRVVTMTSVDDDDFRARAYALGVDLFWEKPGNVQEMKLFGECIESMRGKKAGGGFRGVQSKSLMDLLQLECLSQASSTLRIKFHDQEGHIYLREGRIIDAVAGELNGEEAVARIFSWPGGSFELLGADSSRAETIHKSTQNVLLDAAQGVDEKKEREEPTRSRYSKIVENRLCEGFLVVEGKQKEFAWGIADEEAQTKRVLMLMDRFSLLGQDLSTGELKRVTQEALREHHVLARRGSRTLALSLKKGATPEAAEALIQTMESTWES